MRSRSEAALLGALTMLALACPDAPAPVPPPPSPSLAMAPVVDAGLNAPPPNERLPALVLSLGGVVEVRRAGTEQWVTLAVGEPVQVGDQVRVAADGQLELSFGVAEINLQEGAELELTLLEPREVEQPGGARAGRLAVSYDGQAATAAALAGQARLRAGDQTVLLAEGEFATTRGKQLSPAGKLPSALFLEVSWPLETETNKPSVTIKGKVSGRARVLVGGRKVELTPEGTFEGVVALKPGKQTVVVSASDPFGRRASRTQQFVLDPKALKIKGAVEYQ